MFYNSSNKQLLAPTKPSTAQSHASHSAGRGRYSTVLNITDSETRSPVFKCQISPLYVM